LPWPGWRPQAGRHRKARHCSAVWSIIDYAVAPLGDGYSGRIRISTWRFWNRPWDVELSAIGCDRPAADRLDPAVVGHAVLDEIVHDRSGAPLGEEALRAQGL